MILFFYGTFDVILLESAILEFWRNRKSPHLTNISQTKAGSHLAAIEKGPVVALQVIAVPNPFA